MKKMISYINPQTNVSYINAHIDLLMNFMKICFLAESAPNRSPRPLNTQLPLEISIRIQWKTSRQATNKTEMHNNPSLLSS